jgi:protein-S-isoprenylcysteine O-methyltransferase Ste14
VTNGANGSQGQGESQGGGPLLLLRALLSFLILPGALAGLLPWFLASADASRGDGSAAGGVVLAAGLAVVLWCVRDFYASGRGTLAPWDPPRHLVVVGLYRFMRNPMYVGVILVVAGWALLAGSRLVGLYAVILAVGFHLRVLAYEEPWLARTFGDEWTRYSAAVSRWLPRRLPWSP